MTRCHVLLVLVALFVSACSRSPSRPSPQVDVAGAAPAALQLNVSAPFSFVAYGDTRFTNPADTDASNPVVRTTLVRAIADVHPTFVSIGGDIAYNGYDANDWRVWDTETAPWALNKIPVYPVLGNHDLHGDPKLALGNYFARFPELKGSRYYSVRAANMLMLVLDSSLDELSWPQGQWFSHQLDTVPADVEFVVIMLHHPPYTSSSDQKKFGGGHSARSQEQLLAKMLETREQTMRARIVVFAGHVHNYERHEHGGITYFVTGGGGAHAYPIERAPEDPFQSKRVNYHYLLVNVGHEELTVTMNRLDLSSGKPMWTQPDKVVISMPTNTTKARSLVPVTLGADK